MKKGKKKFTSDLYETICELRSTFPRSVVGGALRGRRGTLTSHQHPSLVTRRAGLSIYHERPRVSVTLSPCYHAYVRRYQTPGTVWVRKRALAPLLSANPPLLSVFLYTPCRLTSPSHRRGFN